MSIRTSSMSLLAKTETDFGIPDLSATPVDQIRDALLDEKGISLYLKREDLNDPTIQGNKWLKLRPSLIDARKKQLTTLLTFGGCYSNHIAATAAAGARFSFNTIGIIRGPEPNKLNHTLLTAKQNGMRLHFVTRSQYRELRNVDAQAKFIEQFGKVYVLPEGGTTTLAIDNCADFIRPYKNQYDYLCCAVGTGGTFSGLIKGMQNNTQLIGFSSLKNADFLTHDIINMIKITGDESEYTNWSLNFDYSFGGYGKTRQDLNQFIESFYNRHKILLEPVYTGKMIFGLYDLIINNHFPAGSKILAIHTGGIQGLAGFPELSHLLKK